MKIHVLQSFDFEQRLIWMEYVMIFKYNLRIDQYLFFLSRPPEVGAGLECMSFNVCQKSMMPPFHRIL